MNNSFFSRNFLVAYGTAILLAVSALIYALALPNQWIEWCILGVAALVAAVVGITADRLLKNAEEKLEQERLLRQQSDVLLQERRSAVDVFADGLETAVFICTERGELVYANRRALGMFNLADFQGRTVLAVTLSYDLQTFISEAFKTRQKKTKELSFTYPQERVGLCEAWLDECGERAFLAIQDVTELRRLERVRRDFVANVSHELRTPLASIRAMAETMADDKEDLPLHAERFLPRMIAEVDRLSLISADLLSLTSAESNPVRKHACDIAEVFRTAVHQLQHKANGKKLSLTYQGPIRLQIEANSSQMSQVAINLIDNAINYTNFGAIAVGVAPGLSTVTIKVQDTGIGIEPEHIARIFERFYRADKARSRATGGTGLGLSIVKHIVEVHGGTVKVESMLNEGTTFTILMPIGDITKHEQNAVD